MALRRNSLAVRVALTLAVITTAVMGGGGAISYRAIKSFLTDQLQQDHRNLADQLAAGLALPVWNFDREQIERVLEGAMKAESADHVVVQLADNNSQQFMKVRDPQNGAVNPTTGGETLLSTRRAISANGEIVGQLELSFTTRLLDEKLHTYGWVIVGLVIVFDALMVVALLVLLQKIVLRPLNEMERFAMSASPDGERFNLLETRHYTGELESLRHCLDAMVRQLGERHAALVKASELLEKERSKLQTMLKIVPTGVAIVDSARRITEANPEFERMLDLTPEKLATGQNLLRRYFNASGAAMSPAEHPNLRAIREQVEIRDCEMQVITENGTVIWTSVSAAPLSAESAVVAVFDITQRKQDEHALKRRVDELKRWQKVTVDREGRLQTLKKEVNELCARLGLEPRYRSQPAPTGDPR